MKAAITIMALILSVLSSACASNYDSGEKAFYRATEVPDPRDSVDRVEDMDPVDENSQHWDEKPFF